VLRKTYSSFPFFSSLCEKEKNMVSQDVLDKLDRLEELENMIRKADLSYIEKGKALCEIVNTGLYRLESFVDFGIYCHKRWEMKSSHAYRLIHAASIAESLSPFGDKIPAMEAHARPLVRFRQHADDLQKVWQAVLDRDEKVTAALIQAVAEELYPTKKTEPETKEPDDKEPGDTDHAYSASIKAKSKKGIKELGKILNRDFGRKQTVNESVTVDVDQFAAIAAWVKKFEPESVSIELNHK